MKKFVIIPVERIQETNLPLARAEGHPQSGSADLYGVPAKGLNQVVKRNRQRFPDDFMFQLQHMEFENLKSQTVTSGWRGTRTLPYAFTEQGIMDAF